MVHDPSDDRTTRRIVRRRCSPHIVEHVERQFFGGFPIAEDPHDPREDDAVRLRVQRMQRELIAFGNGLDEPDPRALGYRHLRIVGIEHIAEG